MKFMETIQASLDYLIREYPMGEAVKDALKLDFYHRLKLEFQRRQVCTELDSTFMP
jgi:hypothetical protein